jgi:hypothetical protein
MRLRQFGGTQGAPGKAARKSSLRAPALPLKEDCQVGFPGRRLAMVCCSHCELAGSRRWRRGKRGLSTDAGRSVRAAWKCPSPRLRHRVGTLFSNILRSSSNAPEVIPGGRINTKSRDKRPGWGASTKNHHCLNLSTAGSSACVGWGLRSRLGQHQLDRPTWVCRLVIAAVRCGALGGPRGAGGSCRTLLRVRCFSQPADPLAPELLRGAVLGVARALPGTARTG